MATVIRLTRMGRTKNMELESHVILKQYEKLESEIEGLDVDNEVKEETKDLIRKHLLS